MKVKKSVRKVLTLVGTTLFLIIAVLGFVTLRTLNRTQIQIDISQNLGIINLSTYSEPPQFAIWLENQSNNELKTIFVTRRAGIGDWEGKTNVPVALPRWFDLFREENTLFTIVKDDKYMAVSGATPKENIFSVRVEVKPGTQWICWIEMNLAGDYNDDYPELNLSTFEEDEFATGQPALLYKAEIIAEEGMQFSPSLVSQSVWKDGKNYVEPVGEGITTARSIFDSIHISVIRPKPKLIDKNELTGL
ncbi:MAG TPA: hypothetical protein ENN90_12915 [Mariniphaga anaerophila]|uniref:Uncharacterized protein n=1 Tax=Mariniphaga anaerophila TaxID=1484053 RepID=A0A831LMP3_9BACT|nr:hypothetical protein [Mariniphaga anaerophila]